MITIRKVIIAGNATNNSPKPGLLVCVFRIVVKARKYIFLLVSGGVGINTFMNTSDHQLQIIYSSYA